jgi:hypothetical protein
LNEDCWLDINGVPARYAGENYRKAIGDYVRLLHSYGQYVELSLARVAPGKEVSTKDLPMPDADHAVEFWKSVAKEYRDDSSVVFGAYSTPHDVGWPCWRDGGQACATGYTATGMQGLVDAIRGVGARQPIAVSGLDRANDLSGWLGYEPHDPLKALIAEVHAYNFSACNDLSCWSKTILPVARRAPVMSGEVGENDCKGGFVDRYLAFARHNRISYIGWTWNVSTQCGSLIVDYSGIPSAYGFVFRENLTQGAATQSPVQGAATAPTTAPGAIWITLALLSAGLFVLGIGVFVAVIVLRRKRGWIGAGR